MSENDSGPSSVAQVPTATRRVRMSKDERRRQLVGIGLRMLTMRPIQDVSLDEVAAEAGISRGLLFHYFPTKTAYYEEIVGAAGRRVARNVAPDEGVRGSSALRQIVERFLAQIERRRDVYLALVHGNLSDLGGHEVAGSLRSRLSALTLDALGDEGFDAPFAMVHGWVAYVEDVAISWSAPEGDEREERAALVSHCERALYLLLLLHQPPFRAAPHPDAPAKALGENAAIRDANAASGWNVGFIDIATLRDHPEEVLRAFRSSHTV